MRHGATNAVSEHTSQLIRQLTICLSSCHTDNNSAEDRYVVIIDFWHPELTEDERTALDFVYDTRNKFETGKIYGQQLLHSL
jgi:hypothetical protein